MTDKELMQTESLLVELADLRDEVTYYREVLSKIAMHSNDRARYLAQRALSRYEKEKS